MKIAIIGLGYVGLPLAVAFARKYNVIGIDINDIRIKELMNYKDSTNELSSLELKDVINKSITLDNKISSAKDCNIFIITVPTPVNESKQPNLTPVINATKSVASIIKKGDIVVYESTVYPGVTEDICVPILKDISSLEYNIDFFVGYSPERINPGDKKHTITKITKVVSGSNNVTLKKLSELYGSIIEAGIYEAQSIKVAEAAKVIENSQRDINIAFVNELAIIFSKMGINTKEVLKAAGTKWNFLNFFPGLVGGHCIGVDPYYLAYKSEELGYTPQIILAGRKLNDSMPVFIVNKIIKNFLQKNKSIHESRALIMGATFKENCPDLRNSKVFDIYKELNEFGFKIDIYDPQADPEIFLTEYGFNKLNKLDQKYNVIVLAVSHEEFIKIDPYNFLCKNGVPSPCSPTEGNQPCGVKKSSPYIYIYIYICI